MEEDFMMDDLFMKIDLLQIENSELENQLVSLNKQLEMLKKEQMKDNMLNIQPTPVEKTDIEKIDLDAVLSKIPNDAIVSITINYLPFENFKSVQIVGDFNFWKPQPMIKEGNSFYIEITILKGYRYFYNFVAERMTLCDFNVQMLENPYKNNQLSNFIEIKGAVELSDFANLNNAKELLDKNRNSKYSYTLNIPEEDFIKKVFNYSSSYSNREHEINSKKEICYGIVKEFYDSKIKKIDQISQEKFLEVFDFFKDRVAKVGETLFLVKDVDNKNSNFKVLRLYDKNGIKAKLDSHLKFHRYEAVSFKNVFENGKFFSHEETEQIMEDHQKSDEILKIYYQTVENDYNENFDDENNEENDNDDEMDNLGYRRGLADQEIQPYKILPEGVDINEYNLVIDKGNIIDVKTRDNGTTIYFEAIHINSKGRKMSGFVSTSMLKIYTTLYSKDIVNIIHIHLNDTSDQIAVDSVFMEKDQAPEDFKEFKLDVMGKKLNYKFLFKDYKLNKIYYNLSENYIDEPKFEEIRVNKDSLVRINQHNNLSLQKNSSSRKNIFSGYYGKVSSIPIGMLARKDKEEKEIERMHSSDIIKEGNCQERHLEELQGFITIDLLFNEKKEPIKLTKLSLPVCLISIIDVKEQIELEKMSLKQQYIEEEAKKNKLELIYHDFKGMEKYTDFGTLSKEISDFDIAKSMLNTVSDTDTSSYSYLIDHDPTVKDMINYIDSIKEELKMNFTKLLRVLSFSNKK